MKRFRCGCASIVAAVTILWAVGQVSRQGECIGDIGYTPLPVSDMDITALDTISPLNAHRLTSLGDISGSLSDQMGVNGGSGATFSPDGLQLAVSTYTDFHGSFRAAQIFGVSKDGLRRTLPISGAWAAWIEVWGIPPN